jgi:hypothetical protein
MKIPRTLPLSLALAGFLPAQAPPAPPPAAEAQAAPVQPGPANLRAQYAWGYAGADGQGKGTLNVLLESASGRTVLELQGLGERLMLLEGDHAAGYRVQIPRRQVDERAATLAAIPLPFFPQLTGPDALYRLLTEGSGPGVKVTKRDGQGPVKMRYQGNDDKGKEVMVWLERKRWEAWTPKPE